MPFLHLVFPRASLRPTTWYNNFFPMFDIEENRLQFSKSAVKECLNLHQNFKRHFTIGEFNTTPCDNGEVNN